MVEGGRSDTHKHTSHWDLHSENYTMKDQQVIVKLRSRSRSGEGQVRVRKVRVRSELCELKDLNINLDLSYKS